MAITNDKKVSQSSSNTNKKSPLNGNGNGGHKKPPVPLIIMLAVIIGTLGWHFLSKPQIDESKVFVSGRIEGYETDVGAKIGGRIKSVKFREGDFVKEGELLVEITDDDIQAQLRQTEAKYKAATSVVDQRKKNLEAMRLAIKQAELQLSQSTEDVSAQIDQQEANLAQANAELSQTKSQLIEAKSMQELAHKRKIRFEKLIGPGAVTKDEYDQALTNYATASATVEARKSQVKANEKRVKVAQALLNKAKANRYTPNIRNAQLLQIQRQLQQAEHELTTSQAEATAAKASIEEISARIAYLNVKCPIQGVVTARSAEPGEVVVAGQTLLSVIDLDKLYLRGYVPESKIGKVRLEDKAEVYLDSFPDKPFSARVTQIDPVASFTPENIYFKEDRVKQVFGVKLSLDKPDKFAKPGMPADAEILVNSPGSSQ